MARIKYNNNMGPKTKIDDIVEYSKQQILVNLQGMPGIMLVPQSLLKIKRIQ